MQRAWKRTTPLTRTLGVVVVVALAATAIWWFGIRDASAATAAPITRTVAASLTTMEKSVSGQRHPGADRAAGRELRRQRHGHGACRSPSGRR